MFLSIYNNKTGEEYLRRLGPNASLDLRAYVRQWVDCEFDGQARPSFSEPGSYIFSGCGDYECEIRRTKRATGSCWETEPFFLEWLEQ